MSRARKGVIGFLGFLLFAALTGFGLANTARQAVLNPDFVKTEMASLEVIPLAEGLMQEQIPNEIIRFMPAGWQDEVHAVFVELEPWLREQIAAAVDTAYDYLWGRTDRFHLTIDVSPVKDEVATRMRAAILADPPAALSFIPADQLGTLFDQAYAQISGQIPDTFEVDETTLNAINPDILTLMNQARRYLGYFQIIYPALIAAVALLVMGIILLDRRPAGATLWLGIPTLISGVVTAVIPAIVHHFVDPALAGADLPPQLDAWVPSFVNDALAPLRVYSIVLIAIGVALLITATVLRRRRAIEGL